MKLLPFSLFLLISLCANAQEEKTSKLEIGAKAGINFAEFRGDDELPNDRSKVGYSLGGYALIPIKEKLYFQPELLWSLQGESSKDSGKYSLSYLNVPLMLKWKTKKHYTELGPQVGFIVIDSGADIPEDEQLNDFENIELAANMGAGYIFDEDWSAGVRYIHGLTNLVDGFDIKSRVLYVGVSYRIFKNKTINI